MWLDQNVGRLTWTAIVLAIGISLYVLCLPFFKSMTIQPSNISGQTPIAVSSADCDANHVSGAFVDITKNSDGSFSFPINDTVISSVWGGGIQIGRSYTLGEVAKWHQGMQIDYDVKTDGAGVNANTDINDYPMVNGYPSGYFWGESTNDDDACDDTGQWKRTGFTGAIPQNKWVHRTVTYWNSNANNVNRYALSDGTYLLFKAPESDRGKTITIKNVRYTVIEKLHE